MTQQERRILEDLRAQAQRHGFGFRSFAIQRLRAVLDPRANAEMRQALAQYLQHPECRGAYRTRRTV